jgi:hypothetical protein
MTLRGTQPFWPGTALLAAGGGAGLWLLLGVVLRRLIFNF